MHFLLILTPSPTASSDFSPVPERISVPLSMTSTDMGSNLKFRMMDKHQSQGGANSTFLVRFVHRDELFWVAAFGTDMRPAVPAPSDDQTVCVGSQVVLRADMGSKQNVEEKVFRWRQTSGPAVALAQRRDRCVFTAPATPCVLEFVVDVQDLSSGLFSFPQTIIIVCIFIYFISLSLNIYI